MHMYKEIVELISNMSLEGRDDQYVGLLYTRSSKDVRHCLPTESSLVNRCAAT